MNLILIAFLFLFGACANPKYFNPPAGSAESGEQKTSNTSCAVTFSSGQCLYWAWEKKPTQKEMGSILFRVYALDSGDGFPAVIDAADSASVELWMPDMNHGSSPTSVEKMGPGQFRAKNVFFVMPGEWEIKFRLNNSSRDEAVIFLSI